MAFVFLTSLPPYTVAVFAPTTAIDDHSPLAAVPLATRDEDDCGKPGKEHSDRSSGVYDTPMRDRPGERKNKNSNHPGRRRTGRNTTARAPEGSSYKQLE